VILHTPYKTVSQVWAILAPCSKANAAEFRGHATGTLVCEGVRADHATGDLVAVFSQTNPAIASVIGTADFSIFQDWSE